MIISKYKRYAPVSGATIQMENADVAMIIVIAALADLAALTLAWPAAPKNGMMVTVQAAVNVASLLHTGAALNSAVPMMEAGGSFTFIWDEVGGVWMQANSGFALSDVCLAYNTTVTSAGNALVYPTDDGTASGNPLFSNIKYVHANFDNSDPNFGKSKPVVAANRKTVTIACVKQAFSGVTVLGINVLGSVAIGAAANGTALTVLVQGKLS